MYVQFMLNGGKSVPMPMISFVIPVYNSEKTISEVVHRICSTMKAFSSPCDFEIILINDGSRDSAFEKCCQLGREIPNVRPYSLSKNFGQSNAIMAGFNMVRGDYVVCLDDDLQTIPEEFPKLYRKLLEGYDVVFGYYEHKQHSAFRNFGTWLNGRMQQFILKKPVGLHTSTYFIVRRYVVDNMIQYNKPFPYVEGLLLLMTGSIASIPIDHAKRRYGKSGYSFSKLVDLWFNGFTNFSVRPLRVVSLLGGIFSVCAFIMMIIFLISKLLNVNEPTGWTSTIVVVLFIGGVQLLSLGLLGEYIGRIYLSVNQTPQFVLRDSRMEKDPAEPSRPAEDHR